MIPNILHYCWFGNNPYPPIVEKCITSWKEKLPDFEIKRWDENNVPINNYSFMKEAYAHKKYAFVSDHARFWILEQYGGIFLDTDVEVIRPFDATLLNNSCFLGFERHVKKNIFYVNPGLVIGCERNNLFIKEILNYYNSSTFLDELGQPNINNTSPVIMTNQLLKKGLVIKDETQYIEGGITVYSTEYFDPSNPRSIKNKQFKLTLKTYSIHHGAGSWVPKKEKIKKVISILSRNIFGDSFVDKMRKK